VSDLAARLRELNPGSGVRRVDHGQAEPDAIFSASLRRDDGGADVGRWLNRDAYLTCSDRHEHGSHARTWLLEAERPIEWNAFAMRLGPIIARHGDHLLRVKGVVHTIGDRRPLVIHGVQCVFHPPVRLDRWTAPPRTTIVAIGDGRAEGAIAEIADALLLSVATAAAA
jgi:G3E family GTPase